MGTTGTARSSVMPDLPTISEAGVPKYEATIWLGLMAPQGHAAGAGRAPQCRGLAHRRRPRDGQGVERAGAMPMVMSVADFTRYVQADIAKWANIVKISGRSRSNEHATARRRRRAP